MHIVQGLIGLVFFIGIAYLLSNDRKKIDWALVGKGLGMQLLLAIAILKINFVRKIFEAISKFFVVVLEFTNKGAEFVLGNWPSVTQVTNGITQEPHAIGFVFVFKVLPTIIFFSALTSLLYYLGILQFIIKGFAWVMTKLMGLTGAESLAAAGNVFIGQTEAPLIVKPYLEKMSRSEIMCLMTGGMATIAGSVFAAYVGFLGGDDIEAQTKFATHLLTASIMSAPAAIVASKILYPESRKVKEGEQELNIPRQEAGNNVLDAISRGTSDGIKLAANVGAMLLVFIAMIAMVNYILGDMIGAWTGLNEIVAANTAFEAFNLEFIFGMLFAPVAWLLGVESGDLMLVGQLLGEKTTINEFVAYAHLKELKEMMSERSVLIATYALCGFANFGSIGIQIGGISAIAPGQRKNLTELGFMALIGGTIACFLTAIIAGLLI